MIVTCEKCRKRYKIDPAKIKGNTISFTCRHCGHTVVSSTDNGEASVWNHADTPLEEKQATTPLTDSTQIPQDDPFKAVIQQETPTTTPPPSDDTQVKKGRRIGLKSKLFFLFFGVPISFVVIASAIYLWQLQSLASRIGVDSHAMVAKLSQDRVNDMAQAVANQCRLFLNAHPGLGKEDFNSNLEFKKLAVQKVGETGYTCVYEVPDAEGKSGVWVHPNEKIIGVDLPLAMQKAMGTEYKPWLDIYVGAYKGKTSSGYYLWKEKDGSLRDKYMTCIPVSGTPYVVAATAYVDEIYRDAEALKKTTEQITGTTRSIVLIVFAVTVISMGILVLFFGNRLHASLTALIDAAERISVGELDTVIKVRSNDEISDLGEAISRMQESIRMSIERLRRRK